MKKLLLLLALISMPAMGYAQTKEDIDALIKKYSSWAWRNNNMIQDRDYASVILYDDKAFEGFGNSLMLLFVVKQEAEESFYRLSIGIDDEDTPDWYLETFSDGLRHRVFNAKIWLDGKVYDVRFINENAEDPKVYDILNIESDGEKFYEAIEKNPKRLRIAFNTSLKSKFGGGAIQKTFNIEGTYAVFIAMANYLKTLEPKD